jgi:hypothetical protein
MNRAEILEKVETFINILLSYATGPTKHPEEYISLREQLLKEPSIQSMLPRFVKTCLDIDQFFSSYKVNSHITENEESLLENNSDHLSKNLNVPALARRTLQSTKRLRYLM